MNDCERAGSRCCGVEKVGPGSGDAGLERLAIMGNGGTGGFADDGVGGMGSERE